MGAKNSLARLSKNDIAMYKKEFEAVDADKSGTLTLEELTEVNVRMGLSPAASKARAQEMLALGDADKDGTVSWAEYLSIYEKQKQELADVFEAILEDVQDQLKALKVTQLPKEDTLALLKRMTAEGLLPIGTSNAMQYEIRNGDLADYKLEDIKVELQRILFRVDSTKAATATGAGATA